MKTLIFLVGISLAFASPSWDKAGKPETENEFHVPEKQNEFRIPEKQYPEVITEFTESIDYSQLPIEELIQLASEHEGLEFLSDANATAAMGIDISSLHPDLVADALATTVSIFSLAMIFIQ